MKHEDIGTLCHIIQVPITCQCVLLYPHPSWLDPRNSRARAYVPQAQCRQIIKCLLGRSRVQPLLSFKGHFPIKIRSLENIKYSKYPDTLH